MDSTFGPFREGAVQESAPLLRLSPEHVTDLMLTVLAIADPFVENILHACSNPLQFSMFVDSDSDVPKLCFCLRRESPLEENSSYLF